MTIREDIPGALHSTSRPGYDFGRNQPVQAQVVALTERREKTHARKQAVMQELLTGRTRLI